MTTQSDAIKLKTETDTGTTVPINYEWKRRTDGPPWEVYDWQDKLHVFETEQDGIDFINREKRMLANATRAANEDVTDQITRAFQNGLGVESHHGEQAAGAGAQGGEGSADVGGQGNRQSRRRARRASNSKKASGRRR